MYKPDQGKSGNESEAVIGIIDTAAKFCFYGGILAVVASLAMLIITASQGGHNTANLAQAESNIATFKQVGMIGGLLLGLGASWLFWGEETLFALMLFVGGGLYFSPSWLPIILAGNSSQVSENALAAIGEASVPLAIIGVVGIAIDLFTRVKLRINEGSRADQLKYGKGLREEKDTKNVFLGKCWQLPYCRKFVRDRCPIYHSRRTCWQERVGCMCEEAVIQNAMEGKVIPSDVVAAAKFIPRNSRYTPQQKAERCRQCVIYNEHQKHKYQMSLPAMIGVLVALFFAVKNPMTAMIKQFLLDSEKLANQKAFIGASDNAARTTSVTGGVIPYAEIVLICIFLILFAYCIRILEYLIFKLKI